ncbi:MAG: alpha/beta hydrolase [Pseudanabaena sp. ELA607]
MSFSSLTRNNLNQDNLNQVVTDLTLTASVSQNLPASLVEQFTNLTETTSRDLVQRMTIEPVAMTTDLDVATALVRSSSAHVTGQPLVCLHGFDSSLLEFRRLLPALEQALNQRQSTNIDAIGNIWLLDLLGFGFTERPIHLPISPATIKTHLYQFWRTYCPEPMVLVGASMGGAAALDFALTYPEAVAKLVLIDSAGLASGSPVGKWLFPPLDRWATQFLASAAVRRQVSLKAYLDPAFVNPDAELCAALHLQMPRWSEGLISFTKSGGYGSYGSVLKQLAMKTLILWGRNDQILGTKDGPKFGHLISKSRLQWIEACGHVPHLERPDLTATAIVDFWLEH